MAVHPEETQAAKQTMTTSNDDTTEKVVKDEAARQELILEHLPPLALVLIVLFCSGALLVFALRDLLATGRNIGGTWDEAMLVSEG